jgi:hypothetical protein
MYTRNEFKKERHIVTNEDWRLRSILLLCETYRWPYRVEDLGYGSKEIFWKATDREYSKCLYYAGFSEHN